MTNRLAECGNHQPVRRLSFPLLSNSGWPWIDWRRVQCDSDYSFLRTFSQLYFKQGNTCTIRLSLFPFNEIMCNRVTKFRIFWHGCFQKRIEIHVQNFSYTLQGISVPNRCSPFLLLLDRSRDIWVNCSYWAFSGSVESVFYLDFSFVLFGTV